MYKSCIPTQIMQDIALFPRKIYTAGTNFTRPPVVTAATNLNSSYLILEQRSRLSKLFIFANLDQINGELKKDNLDKEGHKISSCQIVFVTQRSSRKFLLAHQHSKSAQLNDR